MPRFRASAISALIALLGLALPAFVISISVFGLAGQVQAATITFRFTGQVTELGDDPFFPSGHCHPSVCSFAALGIVLGAPVSGLYLMDPQTPDLNLSPNVGEYNVMGVSFSVGTFFIGTEAPESSGRLTVLNNFDGRDEYRAFGGGPDNFSSFTGWYIVLLDPTGTVFSSDALPLVLPSLSDFATAEGRIDRGGLRFRLTSLQNKNVVPEPASLLLLSAALFGLVTLRRRFARRPLRGGAVGQ